jgi:hypothetical protein
LAQSLAKALRQQRILGSAEEPFPLVKKKYLAESWRVSCRISALEDGNTFMPAPKSAQNQNQTTRINAYEKDDP